MEQIEEKLSQITSLLNQQIIDYEKTLSQSKSKDKNTYVSEYYCLCDKMLSTIEMIDNLTHKISLQIQTLDKANHYEKTIFLNKLLDSCFELRSHIEHLLTSSEQALKVNERELSHTLILQTDYAIRKIAITQQKIQNIM